MGNLAVVQAIGGEQDDARPQHFPLLRRMRAHNAPQRTALTAEQGYPGRFWRAHTWAFSVAAADSCCRHVNISLTESQASG